MLVGVGTAVGVFVGIGVQVGVKVEVGVAVEVGDAVGVGVNVGIGLGVRVYELRGVGVDVRTEVGVAVGSVVGWPPTGVAVSGVACLSSVVATCGWAVASTSGESSPQAATVTTRIAKIAAAVAWAFRNGLHDVCDGARSPARFEYECRTLRQRSLDAEFDVAGDGCGYGAAVLGSFRCLLEAFGRCSGDGAGDGQGAACDLPADLLLGEGDRCAHFELGRWGLRLSKHVGEGHAVAGRVRRGEQLFRARRRYAAVRPCGP